MLILSAFKIGSRARINLGKHAGQEGVVLSRQLNPVPDAPVELGNDAILPTAQTRSWTYEIKLDSGETVRARSMELHATKGSAIDDAYHEH